MLQWIREAINPHPALPKETAANSGVHEPVRDEPRGKLGSARLMRGLGSAHHGFLDTGSSQLELAQTKFKK